MKAEVITVTNRWPEQDYYCHREWLSSLGVNPIILGMNEPWGGLMTKPRRLREYLRRNHDFDCLIFMDSWDQILARPVDEIAEKWKDMGGIWTSGAERNCFPDGGLGDRHPQSPHSYRFLNSGFIISTPQDMLAVLESDNPKLDEIPDDHDNIHPNDQEYFMRKYLDQVIPMNLDTKCELVWNMCGVDMSNIDFTDGIRNRETDTYPMSIHWNGGSKSEGTMQPILEYLKLR